MIKTGLGNTAQNTIWKQEDLAKLVGVRRKRSAISKKEIQPISGAGMERCSCFHTTIEENIYRGKITPSFIRIWFTALKQRFTK